MESEATLSGVVPWEKLKCPEPTIMSIQRLKDLLYSTCDCCTVVSAYGTYDGPWYFSHSSRPLALMINLWYFVKAMNTHQLLLRLSLSSEQSERLGHPFAIESPSSLWSPSELLSFMPRTTNCSIYNGTRTEHSEDKLARNLSHLKVPRKHLCALEFPSSLRLIPVSTLHTDRACLWSFNANILLCSCVWQTYLFLHVPRKPCHLNSLTPWSTMHMHLNRHLHSDHDLHSDL